MDQQDALKKEVAVLKNKVAQLERLNKDSLNKVKRMLRDINDLQQQIDQVRQLVRN